MILDSYENQETVEDLSAGLLSDSDSGIKTGKGNAVSTEPDLQKSKNEQLGLF